MVNEEGLKIGTLDDLPDKACPFISHQFLFPTPKKRSLALPGAPESPEFDSILFPRGCLGVKCMMFNAEQGCAFYASFMSGGKRAEISIEISDQLTVMNGKLNRLIEVLQGKSKEGVN